MAATTSAPPASRALEDPEELTLRLERLGSRLMDLARDGPGKKIAGPLVECVQELRVVWTTLRDFALVFDANRVERMLEQERQLRQAMEILNGTVGSLSTASERTAANVSRQLHELDEIDAVGDARLMADRLRSVTGTVREAATEMKGNLVRTAAELDTSEKIIYAVDEKLREARQQVMQDALTRTLSRTAFEQRLGEIAAQAAAVSGAWCLALADIDGLGTINDRHSRRVGDALLFKIAEIIQTTCETLPGSIVGRLGGEEFGIIFPRCPLREGRQIAEEIRGAVSLARWESKASRPPSVVTATLSLGIVEHRAGEPAAAVLQRTQACLDQAKRRGRNTVVAEG